jgi:hypothetical protein
LGKRKERGPGKARGFGREFERRLLADLAERERRRLEAELRYREPHIYVVGGIGLPSRTLPPGLNIRPFVQQACAQIGVTLHLVHVVGPDLPHERRDRLRWAIRLPGGVRDDLLAERIQDHLRFIECVHGDRWTAIHLVPVRAALIGPLGHLDVERFGEELAQDESPFSAADKLIHLKSSSHGAPDDDLWLWTCLPSMQNPRLERAASFLLESHERAWFANRQRWEMFRRGEAAEDRPIVPSEIARLETATVMAFKVVEALLDNVQANEGMIRRRLLLEGFPAGEKVPFPPHRPLYEELVRLAEARDERAAHGSGSRKSVVTYYEVMGWQTCAQRLVGHALWRGNSLHRSLVNLLHTRSRR